MAKRVLVCGGRAFDDGAAVERLLSAELAKHPDLQIICGYDPDNNKFQGADELAFRWAVGAGVPVFPFPAPWRRFGRSAGPIRNGRMLAWGQPHEVIPLPGGDGTADMVRQAKGAGVPVRETPTPSTGADHRAWR